MLATFALQGLLLGLIPGAPRATAPRMGAPAGPRCDSLLRELFSGALDADSVAAACAPNVLWEDMSSTEPLNGPAEVRAALAAKFPAGSRLVLERLADGAASRWIQRTWEMQTTPFDGGLERSA